MYDRIRNDPEFWDRGVLCACCGNAITGHPLETLVSDDSKPEERELCGGCFACIVERKHGPWCAWQHVVPPHTTTH